MTASKKWLHFAILIVGIAWLLDVLSSIMGFAIRTYVPGGYWFLYESSPVFLLIPSAWAITLICLIAGINYFKRAPVFVRKFLICWCVILAFMPTVRNTILILEVAL